jgi:hypothetical protein
MSFEAPMLEPLTLDAVKAKAIAHHMQTGPERSHFNQEVSTQQRLATLGEQVGAAFKAGLLDNNKPALHDHLLTIAAVSLIWAEILDKQGDAFKCIKCFYREPHAHEGKMVVWDE